MQRDRWKRVTDSNHQLNTYPKLPSSFWLELDQACEQHLASVSLICALARPHWPCRVAKWRHGVCVLSLAWGRADGAWAATFNGLEDDARVVVRDDVGIAVLGFVHFQVGMFPRELLARINGL